MGTYSKKKRFVHFLLFLGLFVVFTPIILMYSLGYNLTKNFALFKTGGVYVFSNDKNAKFYINGELEDEISLFQKEILVKGLLPKEYQISLEKEGFITWNKYVIVEPEKVAEGYPILVPENPIIKEIPKKIPKSETASTTLIENSEYVRLNELFLPPKKTNSSVSTTTATSTVVLQNKVTLSKEKDSIIASWKGDDRNIPFFFCLGKKCISKIEIYKSKNIKTFAFYPSRNDVFFVIDGSKLLVVELDKRNPHNIIKLFESEAKQFDFKVLDNERLVIKEGEKISIIEINI